MTGSQSARNDSFPNSIGATNYTGRLFRGDASQAADSQWTALTDDFADPDGANGPLPGTGPHADSRDMAFDAAGNLLEGDDGGIYKRVSPTQATGVWSALVGNLQNTEFVSVAYSSLTKTAFGGAQDVGTALQTSSGNNVWTEFAQGDGGFVAVDDSEPGLSIRYGTYVYLRNFDRVTFDASNNIVSMDPVRLVGLTDDPQFYSPYVLNTVQPTRMAIGTENNVFESMNQGDTVTDLGVVGTVSSLAYGGTSGGVANPDVLYVGSDLGLFVRTGAGGSLQPLTSYPGGDPADIVLDPTDWRRAFVVSGSSVYMTPDAGQTWTNLTYNLADSELRSIEYITAPSGSTGIVVGGNSGVDVFRFGGSNVWQEAATGLPNAPTSDLHFNTTDNVLLAGTLGRGAWIVVNASDILTPPGLVVSNVTHAEGNSGFTNFIFAVTQPANLQTVTVEYSTSDGTATAPQDYVAQSGQLTFNPGETSKQITIQVVGDQVVEPNETFFVTLSNAVNVDITTPVGTGTIVNDDVDVSINDVAVVEGNSGTRDAVFQISAYGAVDHTITVSYTVSNGTAQGGSDYLPRAGVVTLNALVHTALVTVPVLGDRLNEDNETFAVVLASAQGARIAKAVGVGTILDDDPLPNFYVNDAYVTTTLAGQTSAVFTVGLDAPSGREVDVNYGTADGSAADGTDYAGKTGDLVFAPGVTTLQVSVPVYTNAVYSSNKKFYLDLSGPTNANLYDPDGAATIIYAPAPIGQQIIDDGAAGFAATGPWTNLTNTLAYQLDYDYASAGTGSATATWSFTAIPNGSYEVFARWIPFSNRATNAPFTILNNQTPLATVLVNEQQTPTGDLSNGVTWQSLGTFTTTSNTLRVRLSNNANGYVVADAIRIVANGIPAAVPEIDVSDYDHSINPGDMTPAVEDGTDFGSVPSLGVVVSRTYTITNTGNAPLHLTGSPAVSVGGPNASDFTVVTQPASVVAPGGHTTFQVNFRATGSGIRTGVISIASDDSDEPGYTFFVRGTLDSPAVVPLAAQCRPAAGRQRRQPRDAQRHVGHHQPDVGGQRRPAPGGRCRRRGLLAEILRGRQRRRSAHAA